MNANLEAGAYALAMPAAATTTGTFHEFLPITLSQAVGATGSYTSKPTVRVERLNRGVLMCRRAGQSGINFNF